MSATLAPETTERPQTRSAATGPVPFVVVGGVPGAGKTTVLARVAAQERDVRVLDPEHYRAALAASVGRVLPYRAYRPVVHVLHGARVLRLLLRGPGRLGARALVVHEPATRPRRTAGLARLARARGWCPALLYVDASRAQALAGQHARGRVLRGASFDGHWERWEARREDLTDAGSAPDGVAWQRVCLTGRDSARDRLRGLLREL